MVDEDGHVKRQLPDGLDLGSIPCLVSTSDQGPNNVAALNFCMFSVNLRIKQQVQDDIAKANWIQWNIR
jgi:hypothetical protein